jgi:hypothetical protein
MIKLRENLMRLKRAGAAAVTGGLVSVLTGVLTGVLALGLAGCGSDSAPAPAAPAAVAPTITTQPSPLTVTSGQPASFSVVAAGTAPFSYQWQNGSTNIAGATSATYSIAATSAADNGATLRVVVTNSAGSVTSAAVALTVNPAVAPSVTSQPTGLTLTPGTAATFSVQADGSAPLAYQWQRDGIDVPGATAASYTLATPSAADSGATFRVVVSNAAGSTLSNSVLLSVADSVTPPSITAQPQSASTLDGSPAVLSVAVSGTGPFSYQWRRNGTAIAAATDSIYTTPALTLADSGVSYSVVVSSGAGTVTSNNATVTVNPLPVGFSAQPANAAVTAGQTATFTVAATGSAPISYQWRRNGAAIAGATSASYTTAATAVADNGATFTVVVSNAANAVTSDAATLVVTAAAVAPSIGTAPAAVTVSEGQTATFTVTATGTAPLAYQWRRNAADISGATAASYTTPPLTVAADNAARYSVKVTNAAGSATSGDAVLTVNAATSLLIGRSWGTGVLLETDDNAVIDENSAISDQGIVTVVFRKSNGTRTVFYATRGTPNAASTAPTWSQPVAIDVLNGTAVSNMPTTNTDWDVAGAPGGDVLVYWFHNAACTSATYNTSGTCRYYYTARYSAARGAWDAPVLLGDSPSGNYRLRLNDRGDLLLAGNSWKRTGTSGYTTLSALFMRTATESSFRRQSLDAEPISGTFKFGLDAAGNILLGANYTQNATTDLVAYRGTVASGLGSPQVLDTRGSAASLSLVGVGLNGQQVILWNQNNGVTGSTYAATSSTATGNFSVVDLNSTIGSANASLLRITVSDTGQAIVYDINGHRRRRWTAAGGWLAEEAIPSSILANENFRSYSLTRGGDMLVVSLSSDNGAWGSYDAQRNVVIRAFSPAAYVLGVANNAGYTATVLSESGIAFTALQNKFDVLPTPAAPAGDGRNVTNLWGVFFK